jgi:4-hydroxybenzoate polyprenyltransferase
MSAMTIGLAGSVGRTLTFIRFSHTVFALPFALGSMLVAAGGLPSWRLFGLILAAMVLARTSADGGAA